jgi:choline dehydrogenase
MTETFDYIIIGSGSAGSVITGRLSEAQRGTVCVLEAGPTDSDPFIHIPAGVTRTISNPAINWLYETEPGEYIGGRRISQPRGKTLGGSGSINGHIYNRGQRLDFDLWAQQGNRGWGYADVLPYFKRCEKRIGPGDNNFRGRHGPFTITDIDEPDPLCDAFIASATALGIPRNDDYNGAAQEGVAYAQRSLHKGRRVSPARAFLYPAIKRGNVDIRTESHVTRLLFDGRRCIGVAYRRGGRNEVVYARARVVLSAGTIGSPQILQISGIGPPNLLQDIGVPIVHALPGVGKNLRDHFAVRLTARVWGARSINQRGRGLPLLREVARYVLTRRGALTLTPTLVYCFGKSNAALDRGDLQLTFTPASYPDGVWSGLDPFPGVMIACWQHRPESSGFVNARSANPFDKPAIQPNYLAETEDRRVLVAGIRLARHILGCAPLADFVDREERPGVTTDSDTDLLAFAQRTGTTAYHPIGTCRMGPASQRGTVVDDKLRVHGLLGLHVADASIMPMMPSANTNAATLMIGEKAADLILGKPLLPVVTI